VLLWVSVILIAVNLRPALTSVPTVVVQIQEEFGWSSATAGLLTTLPVVVMGLFALVVPALAQRVGRTRTVTIALVVLTIAVGMRAFAVHGGVLFVSAALAGVGIALATGLVPGLVREQMPNAMGKATGAWTSSLMGGAAIASAITVPLALWWGSWQLALAVWAIPAAIGLILWQFAERSSVQHVRPAVLVRLRELPWRNRTAWALTAFLTINSIVFYSALAWIAPSYAERGWSQAGAGWLFAVFAIAQVTSALTLPALSLRTAHRRTLFAITIVMTAVALLCIAWVPDFAPPLVLFALGYFLSGGFAMSLGLLSDLSPNAAAAARLTAMAFFVTYLIAASGPFIAGTIYDAFDSWAIIFTLLAIISVAQLIAIVPLKKGALVN
jgi:CP family cyanate transporter-like MFS transporter